MHGIIFSELNKYVTANYGHDMWNTLLKDADLPVKFYDATKAIS